MDDVGSRGADGSGGRLVFSKTTPFGARLLMAFIGIGLLAVPWKLLVAADRPTSSPALWLLALSIGAVVFAGILVFGAVVGPGTTTTIDFDRATFDSVMNGGFGFRRSYTAKLADLERIDVESFSLPSNDTTSWKVLFRFRGDRQAREVRSFADARSAEALAEDLRARIRSRLVGSA
jgi:hypothetical protein